MSIIISFYFMYYLLQLYVSAPTHSAAYTDALSQILGEELAKYDREHPKIPAPQTKKTQIEHYANNRPAMRPPDEPLPQKTNFKKSSFKWPKIKWPSRSKSDHFSGKASKIKPYKHNQNNIALFRSDSNDNTFSELNNNVSSACENTANCFQSVFSAIGDALFGKDGFFSNLGSIFSLDCGNIEIVS